jgi:hypothetical protein
VDIIYLRTLTALVGAVEAKTLLNVSFQWFSTIYHASFNAISQAVTQATLRVVCTGQRLYYSKFEVYRSGH